MTKKVNTLEGFGLILILLSFFIQIVETDIESDIRDQENYLIHKKLDYIWEITSNDFGNRYPEQAVHSSINFKAYVDSYKIYSQDKLELNQWEELVKYKWFTNIRLFVFVIGSLMLIIPKFIQIKNT